MTIGAAFYQNALPTHGTSRPSRVARGCWRGVTLLARGAARASPARGTVLASPARCAPRLGLATRARLAARLDSAWPHAPGACDGLASYGPSGGTHAVSHDARSPSLTIA